MHRLIFRTLLLGFVLTFSFRVANPAFAHDNEPRLELSTEQLNPGATLEIRGVAFEPEETMTLLLLGSNFEKMLGEVTTDLEGSFYLLITLTADLVEGEYKVRAIANDHDLTSPVLNISGQAISSNSEGQREEEDGLLAPMPTFPPTPPTAAPSPTVLVQEVHSTPDSAASRPMLLIVAILVGGLIFVAGRKLLK